MKTTLKKFNNPDDLIAFLEEMKARTDVKIDAASFAVQVSSIEDEKPEAECCECCEDPDYTGTLMSEMDTIKQKLDKLERLVMLQPVFFPNKADGASRKDLKKWVSNSVENAIKGELTGVLLNDETLKSLATNEDIQMLFEVMRDELARKEDIDALHKKICFLEFMLNIQKESFENLFSMIGGKITNELTAINNKIAATESFLDMRITETAEKAKAKVSKKS